MSGYNTFGLVELHPPFVALGFASFDSHTRNSTALKTRISYRRRNSCSFGLLRQHQNPSTPYRNSCHSSDEGDVSEPPSLEDEEEDVVAADNGITVQITKLGKRSRRIQSSIQINASLYVVWDILTDYERLADFIPGLATSKVLQKSEKFARLFQVGQQNLVFGLKFNAEGIIDCYEKELQILSYGLRRDIEFRMVEGDFETFEGKWSIEQSHGCCSMMHKVAQLLIYCKVHSFRQFSLTWLMWNRNFGCRLA